MFYWTFRAPFLLEWTYPHFSHVPSEKRLLFCKKLSTKFSELNRSNIQSCCGEVLFDRMDVETEITNSIARAMAAWEDRLQPNNCISADNTSTCRSVLSRHSEAKLVGGLLLPLATEEQCISTADITARSLIHPSFHAKYEKPTLLVIFCGPPSLKTAVIEACENAKQQDRVRLILEVQSLNF